MMSIHDKLDASMVNRDVSYYMDLIHDDFVVVFHKSGNQFSKSEQSEMVTGMMANDKFVQETNRCIYENDDILVRHNLMSYPDGSREAVMLVAMIKNGKIIRMETGATTLE